MKPYRVDLWDSFDREWTRAGREFDDLREAMAECDQRQAALAQGNRDSGEYFAVIEQRSNTVVYRGAKPASPADGNSSPSK